MSSWQFYVAFKSAVSERAWLHSEAVINYKIRSRLLPTLNNSPTLQYFDGAMMQNYKFPSRGSEHVFCLGSMKSEICDLV